MRPGRMGPQMWRDWGRNRLEEQGESGLTRRQPARPLEKSSRHLITGPGLGAGNSHQGNIRQQIWKAQSLAKITEGEHG